MPASPHIDVINRAKFLFTEKGMSPKEILDQLALDLELGELLPGKLPEDVRLPSDRSSINRWADKFGWTPHWREARKARVGPDPTTPFSVSEINDPIWHLAVLKAKQGAHRYAVEYYALPIGVIVNHVLLHVTAEVNPGPLVCRELVPFIRETITKARRDYELGDEAATRAWRDPEVIIRESLDRASQAEVAKKNS